MSQIVGFKALDGQSPFWGKHTLTLEPTDNLGNAAIHVMTFGNPLGSRTLVVGNYTYFGECGKPGAATSDAVWRVTRQENVGGAGTDFPVMHAYVPASGSTPAKYAGFDHVFDNYAALNYAY